MAVVGVSAAIPIDPVAHVDELLGHHDLEGARLLQVDSRQIDEHRVFREPGNVDVCTADRCTDSTTEPPFELSSLHRDQEVLAVELEPLEVTLHEHTHVFRNLLHHDSGMSPPGHPAAVSSIADVRSRSNHYVNDLSPESWFDPPPGSDGAIIDRYAIRAWLDALAKISPHLQLTTFGVSTEGNPLDAVFVGRDLARTDLALLARRRRESIQAMVHSPRGSDWSMPVVLITSGIHATEIGGPQSIPELVYWLSMSEDAVAEMIRERVLTIIVPTLNPDGMDLVTAWHERTRRADVIGSPPPLLYHRYAGHDNNRDWIVRNLHETGSLVENVHDVWMPHVTLDQHQMNTYGPRFVLPPYAEPWEPNVHPSVIAATTELGYAIATDLTLAGMPGVTTGKYFDAWEPSRCIQHYRGGVRILAEAASANLADPIDVSAAHLRNSPLPQETQPTTSTPMPWRGGRWRLRDIMDYHIEAARALLRRVSLRANRWAPLQAVALSAPAHPGFTVHIPFDRSAIDIAANRRLANILQDAGTTTTSDGNGATLDLDQPMGRLAAALLIPKRYPVTATRSPYDVTTHHLPLYLGATFQLLESSGMQPVARARDHRYRFLTIDARCHAAPESFESTCPSETHAVWRAAGRTLVGGTLIEPGTWLVDRERATDESALMCIASGSIPSLPENALPVSRRDVVLLDPEQDHGTDHGWVRWWLDARGIPYVEANVRVAPNLRGVASSTAVIVAETDDGRLPEGMIDAVHTLVAAGADVIAFGASGLALAGALSPAITPIAYPAGSSLHAPGALIRIVPAPGTPLALGLDQAMPAMFQRDGRFEIEAGAIGVDVLARYGARDTLVSGWMSDVKPLRDAPAVVRVAVGSGRLYAFAFKPLFRGQTLATAPLVHNLLYGITESTPCQPSDPAKMLAGNMSVPTS